MLSWQDIEPILDSIINLALTPFSWCDKPAAGCKIPHFSAAWLARCRCGHPLPSLLISPLLQLCTLYWSSIAWFASSDSLWCLHYGWTSQFYFQLDVQLLLIIVHYFASQDGLICLKWNWASNGGGILAAPRRRLPKHPYMRVTKQSFLHAIFERASWCK